MKIASFEEIKKKKCLAVVHTLLQYHNFFVLNDMRLIYSQPLKLKTCNILNVSFVFCATAHTIYYYCKTPTAGPACSSSKISTTFDKVLDTQNE